MNSWSTQQGSSTDLKIITIENVTDYTGYYATVSVVNASSKETISGTTVSISPDVNDGFTVGLLPATTQLLSPGRYLVVFEISKGIDPVTYRKEVNWLLEISESLINI